MQNLQIMILDGSDLTNLPYLRKFGTFVIDVVKVYKYLGIIVQPMLRFNTHITTICWNMMKTYSTIFCRKQLWTKEFSGETENVWRSKLNCLLSWFVMDYKSQVWVTRLELFQAILCARNELANLEPWKVFYSITSNSK